jgi:hypothetical protein
MLQSNSFFESDRRIRMAYCSIDHQTFANDAALLDLHSATAQYTGVASSKDKGSNSSTRDASVSSDSPRRRNTLECLRYQCTLTSLALCTAKPHVTLRLDALAR